MPIYEYQCRSCDHRLEKLQRISDAPLIRCPECGEDSLVKLISAAGFRLKGGGWYETDFKNGKKRNLAGETGADGKSADGGSSGSGAGDGSGSADKPAKKDKPAAGKAGGSGQPATNPA